MTKIGYEKNIIKNKKILGGTPIIKGTRIPVSSVIYQFSQNGCNSQGVKNIYPQLSKKQIQAALEYSAECIE